ncbi:hypothetical protein Q5H92_26375 [Hymenobacter sp. M29]|uniref:Uncharacterized protein n=1 Tax=Hymenobacter mellowenesis TaxID=3063995 RepID=A0ABT9AJ77_9BACT|nr:hypothetical protein [Hymenobacter sp. M29]MDO7849913.1 hypothetical protein [Hymenobacter sp. M29]
MNGINQQHRERRACRKKRFKQSKAKQVVRDAKRSGRANRRECRHYYCERCFGWHTTSQASTELIDVFN